METSGLGHLSVNGHTRGTLYRDRVRSKMAITHFLALRRNLKTKAKYTKLNHVKLPIFDSLDLQTLKGFHRTDAVCSARGATNTEKKLDKCGGGGDGDVSRRASEPLSII